jgi:hypothetical protein
MGYKGYMSYMGGLGFRGHGGGEREMEKALVERGGQVEPFQGGAGLIDRWSLRPMARKSQALPNS